MKTQADTPISISIKSGEILHLKNNGKYSVEYIRKDSIHPEDIRFLTGNEKLTRIQAHTSKNGLYLTIHKTNNVCNTFFFRKGQYISDLANQLRYFCGQLTNENQVKKVPK